MIEIKGKYNTAKVFTDNIEEEAISQIVNLLNQEFVQGAKVRIMPDCLTEDTEVLTDKGFKLIKDLQMNDKVANYNHNNSLISFSYPKNIIKRLTRKNEKIYEYYNKQHNFALKVSENHRMALKGKMGELAKNIESIKMNEMLFNGCGLTQKYIINKYTDNEIRIIAWIVGDGYINSTHNTHTDSRRISFGLKKQRKIDRITELLEKENIKYAIYKSNKQAEIYISVADSAKYIQYVGKDKKYPNDFIFLNKEQATIFLNEVIQVDGDYEAFINDRGYRANSSRKVDLDIVSAIVSINFGYSKIKNRGILKNSFQTNKELLYLNVIKDTSLNYSKSGVHNRIIKRREINYTGQLVCLECETSYFIAKQNGLTFITGNCHAGAGCVIGFTADLGDKVIPNLVGVDIGCSMLTVELGRMDIDLEKLDKIIHENVPSGTNIHEGRLEKFPKLEELYCYRNLKDTKRIERSIGTLGGGNHFIEIDVDSRGNKYLVIHTGSRNLGHQVATLYQDLAVDLCSGKEDYYDKRDEIIRAYKEQSKRKEIQQALIDLKKQYEELQPNYPKELCFLTGKFRDEYLHDMGICQEYAGLNRVTIANIILRNMFGKGLDEFTHFQTVHNYIDFKDNIIRKGAISAYKGEKVLIPINMRDGSILAVGKGNKDWNNSAPHGAGRLMSRTKAKEKLNMNDFKQQMEGVYSTSISENTLDEAPMAYKPIDEILENIKDTVEVIDVIKPIYNFKA